MKQEINARQRESNKSNSFQIQRRLKKVGSRKRYNEVRVGGIPMVCDAHQELPRHPPCMLQPCLENAASSYGTVSLASNYQIQRRMAKRQGRNNRLTAPTNSSNPYPRSAGSGLCCTTAHSFRIKSVPHLAACDTLGDARLQNPSQCACYYTNTTSTSRCFDLQPVKT